MLFPAPTRRRKRAEHSWVSAHAQPDVLTTENFRDETDVKDLSFTLCSHQSDLHWTLPTYKASANRATIPVQTPRSLAAFARLLSRPLPICAAIVDLLVYCCMQPPDPICSF